MEAVSVRKATENEIKALRIMIERLLEDKDGKFYQDNIVKFSIPEEYVKKAFSQEALVDPTRSGKTTFHLAWKDGREILGFVQVMRHDSAEVELDRIVVFPGHERMGVGTKLLKRAVADQKKRGAKTIIVRAGRDEAHAIAFYEKNGFKKMKEEELESPWGKKISLVVYRLQLMPT
jgi:ribosomal protein S18 acetylase RimI-like enzyme